MAADYVPALRDREVLAIARREARILVTNDRDIGELVFRWGETHSGVILLRLVTTSLAAKIERLHAASAHPAFHKAELVVVAERSVRVRHAR